MLFCWLSNILFHTYNCNTWLVQWHKTGNMMVWLNRWENIHVVLTAHTLRSFVEDLWGRYWYHSLHVLDNIYDWALALEFLNGCPLFYNTPVSHPLLICQDRSMQTLELLIYTMSSVCPSSWCNPTLKSEPPKINKWNPNQKCCSPLDGCQRGRMSRPDLILFPNHMMHSDN